MQGGRARQPSFRQTQKCPQSCFCHAFAVSKLNLRQLRHFVRVSQFCPDLDVGQKESVFGSNMDKRKLPSKHPKGQLDPPSVT